MQHPPQSRRRRRRRRPTLRPHLVVDGSALAGQDLSVPSVARLLAAIAALKVQFPETSATVLIDAALPHRVSPSERPHLERALLEGRVVAPPAGTVGGTVGFTSAIVARIGTKARTVSCGRFSDLTSAPIIARFKGGCWVFST